MSAEGFKIQLSIKDNDGDMVNFRADTNEELAHELQTYPYADHAQAKANLRGAGALGQIVAPVQPAAPAASAPGWVQQQAPQQQAAPPQNNGARFHPEGLLCTSCGAPVQWKEINSKGKTFQLWTCPNQRSKGDGHFSQFAN